MSSAIFLCIGSRGDVEPPVALANALQNAGILGSAHFYLTSEFRFLVEDDGSRREENGAGSRMCVMNAESLSMASFGAASKLTWDPDLFKRDRVKAQLYGCGGVTQHCVNPLLPTILDDCKRIAPSFLVTTTMGAALAATVSDVLAIPSIVLHMQPNAPTSAFPCYLASQQSALDAARSIAPVYLGQREYAHHAKNEDTYRVFAEGMFAASLPWLNQFRKGFNLPELGLDDVFALLKGEYKNIHALQSYPPIIPRPDDLPKSVENTSPLADTFVRPSWDPKINCPHLMKYLEQGEAPLAMSVGSASAPGTEAEALTLAVISAFASARVSRVVVLGDVIQPNLLPPGETSDDEAAINLREWAAEHVYMCKEDVQFAWLFPKCSGIVAHGGAGTVSTALAAGVPVAVLPDSVDQFFWAELIGSIGLGANASKPLGACSKEDIANAVVTILSRDVKNRAGEFAQRQKEQSPRGYQQAVQWIHDNVILTS